MPGFKVAIKHVCYAMKKAEVNATQFQVKELVGRRLQGFEYSYLSNKRDFLFNFLRLFFQTSCTFQTSRLTFLEKFFQTSRLIHRLLV